MPTVRVLGARRGRQTVACRDTDKLCAAQPREFLLPFAPAFDPTPLHRRSPPNFVLQSGPFIRLEQKWIWFRDTHKCDQHLLCH